MTPKQTAFYWRLWRNACAAQGWDQHDNAIRHSVHVMALGKPVSSKRLDNQQFDQVKDALLLLADPDNLAARVSYDNPEIAAKRRVLYGLNKAADKHYIQSISADVFGTIYYEDLPLAKLQRLRVTVANRMRTKSKAAEQQEVECPF